MGCPPTGNVSDIAERERWVFTYGVEGDLRFISHRDTLRMFQRALARASLPVRYSAGFNPHARLSIPLPRPVGVASQAEAIIVEFERRIDGDKALRELDTQMPADIHINGVRRLRPRERLWPALVRYSILRDGRLDSDLASRVRRILQAGVLRIERTNPKEKQTRWIDVRPYIVAMHIDDNTVEFTLRVTNSGTARPTEIVELLGLDASSVSHRIRRLEVQWHDDGQRTYVFP